jgi:hypothetical protein
MSDDIMSHFLEDLIFIFSTFYLYLNRALTKLILYNMQSTFQKLDKTSPICHVGILSFDIMSFNIMSFDIMSFNIMLFDIMSFDIVAFGKL